MSNTPEAELVTDYRFRPDHLAPDRRLPGISGFMRIKNGAAFLAATIRSHIAYFDEIVAVHNQSTDGTPEILAGLAREFAPKIRIFHYSPKVHPPGSEAHAREPADSPASFVNQSNFALSRTRCSVAMKLDDDHLAMPERVAALTGRIRHGGCHLQRVLCFAGINLARDENGAVGILASEPLVGTGDHFFFEVGPDTYFIHDPRFEDFSYGGKRRELAALTYWHLKYLKPDFGFGNREVDDGDNPRFSRKRDRFMRDRRVIRMADLLKSAPAGLAFRQALPLPEKARLKVERWRALTGDPPTEESFFDLCRKFGIALPMSSERRFGGSREIKHPETTA